MNKKHVSLLSVVILSIFLVSAGCSSFRSEVKGSYELPPVKNYGADKVSVLFIFSHVRQTKGYDAVPKLGKNISGFDDIFNDALNEISNIKEYSTFTNYASDVNDPKRQAEKERLKNSHDYVINVKIREEKSFAGHFLGTLVSTVSATMVPVPYTRDFSIQADVFNSDGLLVNSYSRNASLTKWIQSMMIFLYPFHPEKRKMEEIYVEFLHDIFKQIESEKILVM